MSRLPEQILPQSDPWGTVNNDGTVTIEQNWWLFLYNVAMNSIDQAANSDIEQWAENQALIASVAAEPVAQPIVPIAVTASPFVFTAPFDGAVTVTGPMQSAASSGTPSIVLKRQNVSVNAGFLNGTLPVRRSDQVIVTYVNSVTPTMNFLPA